MALVLPVWLLMQEMLNGLTSAGIIAGAAVWILYGLGLWLWYKMRGTTHPLIVVPLWFDVAMFTALLGGLFVRLEPQIWQLALLLAYGVAFGVLSRATMPKKRIDSQTDHPANLIALSIAQRDAWRTQGSAQTAALYSRH